MTTENSELLSLDPKPKSSPHLQQHLQQRTEVSPTPPPPLETCDSPCAAELEDDKSGIIKQAWMAVQALSSASCSHALQLEQPAVCDDTRLGAVPIEMHSASSQDEDTMDERESFEEGYTTLHTAPACYIYVHLRMMQLLCRCVGVQATSSELCSGS